MESAMRKRKLDPLHVKEIEGRARSLTVGTSFGGTVELTLRKFDSSHVFAILQPVEVVELIHQLSASIGCHIHIQPRRDFASWRDWKYTEEELAHYRGEQDSPAVGFAPHANDMAPHQNKGQVLPPPEQQPGLQPSLIAKDDQNETVAIEKPTNRRSTKRAAKAT